MPANNFQATVYQTYTHLAVVTETWPPEVNGVALTIKHLVEGLIAQGGYKIQLIRPRQTVNEKALHTESLQECLLGSFSLPFYSQVRLGYPHYFALKKQWQQQRPDLVQIVTEGPLGYAALWAAQHLKIPVISDFHTHFAQYSRYYHLTKLMPLIARYLRHFHNQTRLTLVPTPELRATLQTQGYQRLAILPRGIDQVLFNPSRRSSNLRQQLGMRPEQLLVIVVSRLAQEKNLDLAFSAFRAIQQSLADARFLIVGDGPELARLQAQYPDCLFVGIQKGVALAEYYASADLFIYPSTSETFGNVILEAMASGLAVLAFDYAAAHQHIRHQKNGCTVPLNDTTGFIQTALELALNPQLRQQVGQAAAHTTQTLTWQGVSTTLHQLIQTTLQELKHELITSTECS